jgi:hypothetical protein
VAAGLTVHLAKPVDTEELIECIDDPVANLATTTPRPLCSTMKPAISSETSTTERWDD